MLLIPAVDVFEGRLARLESGSPVPVEAFGADPLEAAGVFASAGASWIHLVDMDLAFGDEPGVLDLVPRLKALGVRIQISGGITGSAEVETYLSAGADRVVLSSAALGDRAGVSSLIDDLAAVLAIGIESDGNAIRPRGDEDPADGPELAETLGWLVEAGAARFVFTQIGRVGSLSGPDLQALGGALALAGDTPSIASGGVACADDLRKLSDLRPALEGVVVGRALYTPGSDLLSPLRSMG